MMDNPTELGPWKRERVLGSGGFGIVTLWKNDEDDKMIALKKYRGGVDNLMTERQKERWAREVEIMQRLSHPNVVKAVPVPESLKVLSSDLPTLCMEFCRAGDLRQVLNQPQNCCGLSELEVRNLISDVKDAVHYLHKERITHRDLKPENIVLQESPDSQVVYKLIDLGYAKELDKNSICSSFVGTLQYLAPELFMNKTYTSSVDYWSLGLVTHEAITGVRPFLPNMTPVNWMTQAQKKTHNDICIYETMTKEIIFSQQLFVENHISQCLRDELEKWLRLALEWDPKKRGRSQPDKQLVIFSELEEILKKKIITVFCVKTYERRSYQVDNATAVNTLQLWIARDTKQPIEDQLLLLPSGKPLKQDGLAIECWDPNIQDIMLYMFSKEGLALPDVQLVNRMPPLVEWMLTHEDMKPNSSVEYFHQKRVSCQAVFFLKQEFDLYQIFIEAYSVKMLAMMENSFDLGEKQEEVSAEMHQLIAMHKLLSESLEYDTNCYQKISTNSSIAGVSKLLTEWTDELNKIAEKISQLHDKISEVKRRVIAACKCAAQLQTYHEPGKEELGQFEILLKQGYTCYDILQKQKHDTKIKRVVYNCLKNCDKALRDADFAKHLAQLSKCEKEMSGLSTALVQLKKVITHCKDEVTRCQQIKQKNIWRLISNLAERDVRPQNSLSPLILQQNLTPMLPTLSTSPNLAACNPFKLTPSSKPSSPIPQQKSYLSAYPTLQVSPNPSSSFVEMNGFDTSSSQQPLENPAMLGTRKPSERRPSNLESGLDSSSVIGENLSLRYAMQDVIINFTKCNQSILAESSHLDWNYLQKLGDQS